MGLILVAFQLIMDLKLLGVSNDILSILLLTTMPIAMLAASLIDTRYKLAIVDKRKRKKKVPTYYTFVEQKEEFKKKQQWPMIELESGRIIE